MRVVTRYLGREIYKATAFVFVAFLALFVFFDLINELDDVGKGRYRLAHAFLFVLLSLPGHVYELFPIAVLIGTLVALSTLAANSEYTVMRVSGFSPLQARHARPHRRGVRAPRRALRRVDRAGFGADRPAAAARPPGLQSAQASHGLWVKSDTQFVNIGGVARFTLKREDLTSTATSACSRSAGGERRCGANKWQLASVGRDVRGGRCDVRTLPTLNGCRGD
jgi:lipopolysaccharide export system permease protein